MHLPCLGINQAGRFLPAKFVLEVLDKTRFAVVDDLVGRVEFVFEQDLEGPVVRGDLKDPLEPLDLVLHRRGDLVAGRPGGKVLLDRLHPDLELTLVLGQEGMHTLADIGRRAQWQVAGLDHLGHDGGREADAHVGRQQVGVVGLLFLGCVAGDVFRDRAVQERFPLLGGKVAALGQVDGGREGGMRLGVAKALDQRGVVEGQETELAVELEAFRRFLAELFPHLVPELGKITAVPSVKIGELLVTVGVIAKSQFQHVLQGRCARDRAGV